MKVLDGMPVAYLYMTLLIVSVPRLENENKNVTWKMLFVVYKFIQVRATKHTRLLYKNYYKVFQSIVLYGTIYMNVIKSYQQYDELEKISKDWS